jgi:histidine phosphotransfer protein HptB
MMSDTTIDRAVFEDLKSTAGADFVVELVDTFFSEAPTMLAELRRALAAADADAFRRTAHSLKSNADTFGATALATRARSLELGGLAAARDGGASLDALEHDYTRAAQALAELRHA